MRCKNDAARSYRGTEPSPKGKGFCAHAEKVGARRRGLDGRTWVVARRKAGSHYWARAPPAGAGAGAAAKSGRPAAAAKSGRPAAAKSGRRAAKSGRPAAKSGRPAAAKSGFAAADRSELDDLLLRQRTAHAKRPVAYLVDRLVGRGPWGGPLEVDYYVKDMGFAPWGPPAWGPRHAVAMKMFAALARLNGLMAGSGELAVDELTIREPGDGPDPYGHRWSEGRHLARDRILQILRDDDKQAGRSTPLPPGRVAFDNLFVAMRARGWALERAARCVGGLAFGKKFIPQLEAKLRNGAPPPRFTAQVREFIIGALCFQLFFDGWVQHPLVAYAGFTA